MSVQDIRYGIESVRGRIDSAAERSWRDPAGVTLLGATKTIEVEEIRHAIEAGLTVAGENRVQELLVKQQAITGIQWHLIGPLQRNKVNKVVGGVALIHSVDSVDIARAIAERATVLGVVQDVLLEVNTSGEATKHGFAPQEVSAALAEIATFSGIRATGLMTMAAPGDPGVARSCFAMLARLVEARPWPLDPPHLSMGMSEDFEEAVEEGATIVRIGSAIFGARRELGLGA